MVSKYCMYCGDRLSKPYSIEEDSLYYCVCYKCDTTFVVEESINCFGKKSIDITVEKMGA